MKNCLMALLLASLLATTRLYCQSAGTEYVKQVDFGDTQGSTYPTTSGQWVFLTRWEPVQLLGNETDWFGPNYKPLGNSSHPHYVMLDDDDLRHGGISGNILDLEYRLVNCDFSYHLYNETDTNAFYDGGTLYVVLAASNQDIMAFDHNNPAQFEASGLGQVLFEFDIPGGFATSLSGPWDRLSQLFTSAARTRYALGLSPTGTPGSPFTEVGLVWRSDGFNETRICIDDFSLLDVCPNCVIREPLTYRGCMDSNWDTPIANNYYYYSATIRDSATNTIVFEEVHRPARFQWDGFGNQGSYNGIQVPYGQMLKAHVTYYSCLRQGANIRSENYSLQRTAGCVDLAFGGSKTDFTTPDLIAYPNPVPAGGSLTIKMPGRIVEGTKVSLLDLAGRAIVLPTARSIRAESLEVDIPASLSGIFIVQVSSEMHRFHTKILVY